jgi:hypothetical protein
VIASLATWSGDVPPMRGTASGFLTLQDAVEDAISRYFNRRVRMFTSLWKLSEIPTTFPIG